MHSRDDGTECSCDSERYCTQDIHEAFEEDSNRKGHDRQRGYYKAHRDYQGDIRRVENDGHGYYR